MLLLFAQRSKRRINRVVSSTLLENNIAIIVENLNAEGTIQVIVIVKHAFALTKLICIQFKCCITYPVFTSTMYFYRSVLKYLVVRSEYASGGDARAGYFYSL